MIKVFCFLSAGWRSYLSVFVVLKKIKPSGENDTFWSLDRIMKNNIEIKQTFHIFYSKYIINSCRYKTCNRCRQSMLIGIADDNS